MHWNLNIFSKINTFSIYFSKNIEEMSSPGRQVGNRRLPPLPASKKPAALSPRGGPGKFSGGQMLPHSVPGRVESSVARHHGTYSSERLRPSDMIITGRFQSLLSTTIMKEANWANSGAHTICFVAEHCLKVLTLEVDVHMYPRGRCTLHWR